MKTRRNCLKNLNLLKGHEQSQFTILKILIIFLLSNLFIASKNSFFFLPVKLKVCSISFIGISGFPNPAFLLWRCFTMSLSSFPHLHVVLRMRTAMALASLCVSAVFFLVKIASQVIISLLNAFKSLHQN